MAEVFGWLRRPAGQNAQHGLRYMVAQASRHPGSLAWLLSGYDLATICTALRCDEATACRCLLTPRPPAGAFSSVVQRLAHQYGVDEAALAHLIREAEAGKSGLTSGAGGGRGEVLSTTATAFAPH